MDNQGVGNIPEIAQALNSSLIRYDPNRIDYTLNDSELSELGEIGNSLWKDVFLATLSFALPCLINAFSSYCKLAEGEKPSSEIFLNALLGGIAFILSVIFFFTWQRNRKRLKVLIERIKNKPIFKISK